MKNSAKISLGIAIGVALGAAIAYFSDKEKRDSFVDGVVTGADKAKDSLVEAYYEAKNKYYQYRDRLREESSIWRAKAGEMIDEGVEFAQRAGRKAEEKVEEFAEKAKEQLK